MKVIKIINTERHEEIDVQFPIYSMVERENETLFVKITEGRFQQIECKMLGIEIFDYTTDTSTIPAIWLDNQCSGKEWNEVLESLKKTLSKF